MGVQFAVEGQPIHNFQYFPMATSPQQRPGRLATRELVFLTGRIPKRFQHDQFVDGQA